MTDDRLGAALVLLATSKPRRMPGHWLILALCAFIAATTFFVYMATSLTAKPAPNHTAPQTVAAPAAPTVNKADFELSGSSLSAESAEPVTDAVLIGREESR
ncbi:hypothetical protein [Asticcacaulis sp. 201]|uniref:hypothetical protein n=1 Tax=Asticcacaulis sp. 201 TaxID=3028787 RepID=UPI0029168FE8|nr:hypothetical protein [Asticcacaulis sp. 201]MDV6329329.1 hypothetical protein [Asticcacaulis sp. 201]